MDLNLPLTKITLPDCRFLRPSELDVRSYNLGFVAWSTERGECGGVF
jgi:hypothetical protein